MSDVVRATSLKLLSRFGEATGIDCSPTALEFFSQRGLKNLYLCDVSEHLPFSDESFDVVCAFDILEHVEDDRRLLKELRRVCKSGGRLVLTIPALQLLWSEHDETF